MQTINELVSSLGYEETLTEIYSVDSQFSAGGGVVVQVGGCRRQWVPAVAVVVVVTWVWVFKPCVGAHSPWPALGP